jgi:hypothetical protein
MGVGVDGQGVHVRQRSRECHYYFFSRVVLKQQPCACPLLLRPIIIPQSTSTIVCEAGRSALFRSGGFAVGRRPPQFRCTLFGSCIFGDLNEQMASGSSPSQPPAGHNDDPHNTIQQKIAVSREMTNLLQRRLQDLKDQGATQCAQSCHKFVFCFVCLVVFEVNNTLLAHTHACPGAPYCA